MLLVLLLLLSGVGGGVGVMNGFALYSIQG